MTVIHRRGYLVECFLPGVEVPAVKASAARVRDAAATLRDQGWDVEYVETLLVSEDEIVFHLFAAADSLAVREANIRAQVCFERIVEVLALDGQPALNPDA